MTGDWRPMVEAPKDGTPFLAGLWVTVASSDGDRKEWQQFFIWADDMTEDGVHPDCDHGWNWEDYSHFLALEIPAPPADA